MSKKKVLAIDGGGMKGIVSAVLLRSLEDRLQYHSNNYKARIADYFDLIAGTSTGSILTALYLFPNERGESKFSAKEVVDCYYEYGEYIFKKQKFYPFWGPKYTNKNLEEMLVKYFGDATLGSLRKPCLMTSYDTMTRSAVFFNSVTGRKDENRNYLLRDAILASTAAPTYFPPSCFHTKDNCYNCLIDGGVFSNNPALCALIEAMKLPGCDGIGDTICLSVGNVKNTKSYTYQKVRRFGLIQWAVPIFDILMDASEQTVDYQLKKIYKSVNHQQYYYRMVLNTEEEIPKMDDYSKEAVHKLTLYGEKLANREKYRIDELAKRLVMERDNDNIVF